MTARVAGLLGVLLVVAACAAPATQTSGPSATVAQTGPGTEAPLVTEGPAATTASPSVPATTGPVSTAPPVPAPNGPPAPDFTLAMGDGTSFTLSEEARPVFMIFWAEW